MTWNLSLANLFRSEPVRPATIPIQSGGTAPSATGTPAPNPQSPVAKGPVDGSQTRTYGTSELDSNLVNFGTPVTVAEAPAANPQGNSGTYVADSASSLEGAFLAGLFNFSPSPIDGAKLDDEGKQLHRMGNHAADQALSTRLATDGLDQDKIDSALQMIGNLRDKMPSLQEKRELNAYIVALANNPNQKLKGDQLIALLDRCTAMVDNGNYQNHSHLPNHEVMLSALHDVAMPSNISQKNVGTCMATSAQMQLAMADPLRYLNLVDSLAAGESVKIGGQTLKPNYTFLNESSTTGYRTPSSALVENSLMDAIDGERSYNSSLIDISKMDKGEVERLGIEPVDGNPNLGKMGGPQTNDQNMGRLGSILTDFTNRPVELSRTSQSATGADGKLIAVPNPEKNAAMIQTMQNISPPISLENPVLIYMKWSKPGEADATHALNVVNITPNDITVMNPWGRYETFSVEEMNNRLYGALLPQ